MYTQVPSTIQQQQSSWEDDRLLVIIKIEGIEEKDSGKHRKKPLIMIPHTVCCHIGNNGSLEIKDIFNRIVQSNKDSNMMIHEGDIVIKKGRSAISCAQCLWSSSSLGMVNVPYILSSLYSDQQVTLFKTVMQEFETLTCVRFVPHKTETDFLNITASDGCASYIGRIGGVQKVFLSADYCMSRGIIQHELNHAIGFFHEQSRSDRDNHVTIMTQYISPENVANFQKYNTNNLGLEYDYASVMHYPRNAFSTVYGQDTIIPKPDPNVPIGQRDGLSVLDVSKINKLYNCNLCANLLNNLNGTFTSANYPSSYPNNANCVWLIRTPAGQVALQFKAFDLQSSTSCVSDYLTVYDGPSKTSPLLLNKTCGAGLIPLLVASTNQMLLEFVSNKDITGTGFKAVYSAVQCGGAYYASTKTFSSPGYPISYYTDLDCGWIITAPTHYKIILTVHDFAIEYEPTCGYDYLAVFDGPQTTSPLIGKYCSRVPPPLVSTGNSMLVKFHSDNSVQLKGFQASYVIKLIRYPRKESYVQINDIIINNLINACEPVFSFILNDDYSDIFYFVREHFTDYDNYRSTLLKHFSEKKIANIDKKESEIFILTVGLIQKWS
ncbi:embryonic protein UVS.2-like [Pseudophryne corroboree]|uniref:embryonic protein UVS.2-like n=1 Tax=Pseudophryne corroboree TaxID=495146 RepID=UPI0030817D65